MTILKQAMADLQVDPVTHPINITDGGAVIATVDEADDTPLNVFNSEPNSYQTNLQYDRGEGERLRDLGVVLELLTGTLEKIGTDKARMSESVVIQESINLLIKSYEVEESNVATESWSSTGTLGRFFNRENLKKISIAIWKKFREYMKSFFKLIVSFLKGVGDFRRKSDGKAKKVSTILSEVASAGIEFNDDVKRIHKVTAFKSALPGMLNLPPGDYPVAELMMHYTNISHLYHGSVIPSLNELTERLNALFNTEYASVINNASTMESVRGLSMLVDAIHKASYGMVSVTNGLLRNEITGNQLPSEVRSASKVTGDAYIQSLIDVNSLVQLPNNFNIFSITSDAIIDGDMREMAEDHSVMEIHSWKTPGRLKESLILPSGDVESISAFFNAVNEDLTILGNLELSKRIKEIGDGVDMVLGLTEKHLLDKLTMLTMVSKLGYEPNHVYGIFGSSFIGKADELLALGDDKLFSNNQFYIWATSNSVLKKVTSGEFENVDGLSKAVTKTYADMYPDMVAFLKNVSESTTYFRELDNVLTVNVTPLPENIDIAEKFTTKVMKDSLLVVKGLVDVFQVGAVVNYEKLLDTAINYCGNTLTELSKINKQ